MSESLVSRLIKRADIRLQINTRKSVQEGQPDRIASLLYEAAERITQLEQLVVSMLDQENTKQIK